MGKGEPSTVRVPEAPQTKHWTLRCQGEEVQFRRLCLEISQTEVQTKEAASTAEEGVGVGVEVAGTIRRLGCEDPCSRVACLQSMSLGWACLRVGDPHGAEEDHA